ncbi:MAG TPA: hypothetical protein VIT91_06645 [Chthoniobacterales bacterium]
MSDYRLLVDWEVIEKLNQLPPAKRRIFRDAFLRIAATPDRLSDYRESNPKGITLDVYLCHGFAITYWIDFADRHVKILEFQVAEGP